MKKGDYRMKTGFTIIEVSLVLAIAGLIFLMVFIALPGLRASQRDAERRENVSMFLQSVKKYQSNNRGALPTTTPGATVTIAQHGVESTGADSSWQKFYNKYLGDNFSDPDGNYYKLKIVSCGEQADIPCDVDNAQYGDNITFPNEYQMLVVTKASCSGTQTVGTSNPRRIAVLYRLERAGVYCANS